MPIQLNSNEILTTISNWIVSLHVHDLGISNLDGIYSSRRVEGSRYGDTIVHRSMDVVNVYNHTGRASTSPYNLLTEKFAPAPYEQKIVLDVFKQIPLTVENELSRRAWGSESKYSEFASIQFSAMSKTREVYEHTKFTRDIINGAETEATEIASVDLEGDPTITGYDLIKWRSQEMFRQIEDTIEELREPSRNYNDIGFVRNYKLSDFDIVLPTGILSSVSKHDIPFLFNPDSKISIKEVHWRYFGSDIATAGTVPANNTTIRANVEKFFDEDEDPENYFRTGDLLPAGTVYGANEAYTATYETRPNIMVDDFNCFLIHKRDFPVMSAFVRQGNFNNPQLIHSQNYLTFGHNNVLQAHIQEYALLKISFSAGAVLGD